MDDRHPRATIATIMTMQEPEQPESDFDPEGPDPEETDVGDMPSLLPCPHCRKMITDEAEICPHCHREVDLPPLSSSWSCGVVLVICLLIVLFAGGALLMYWR